MRACVNIGAYDTDKIYGERLRISKHADSTEVEENIRAARALLGSFPGMAMQMRKHVSIKNVKNPEYLIDDAKADRKGILSENGVANGFNKAIKQECEIVVIDLDMHPEKFPYIRVGKLTRNINNRHADFEEGIIKECYVIFNNKAARIGAEMFVKDPRITKTAIEEELGKIKGSRSYP